MELNKQQKTTLGAVVVLAVFGALIYSASDQKLEVATLEATSVLPVILPIEAVALPPLTELPVILPIEVVALPPLTDAGSVAIWNALEPDGIPLLEIMPIENLELPPLVAI